MSDNSGRRQVDTVSIFQRDELLKRWVKQPPTNPNMQYLRDAERDAAITQLGEQTNMLDLASESNVTKELNAERVTRLDFAPAASSHAQQVLGETVDRYAVTVPEWPRLPFGDAEFDAVVSIGPFDWKFLNIDLLLTELHRVMSKEGLFVFSVPTPRSPYAAEDSYRFQYYTPKEIQQRIHSDWRLLDRDLLFQYPDPIHTAICKLPDDLQGPFVDIATLLSDWITDWDRWDKASYLVLGMEPIDYRNYLEAALECVFRDVDSNGFWDDNEGKIIRALEYTFEGDGLSWGVDDNSEWRYAPFAAMGIMRWRASALGKDRYDEKIQRLLSYFNRHVTDSATLDSMPSYGIGPLIMAFSVSSEVFKDQEYEETAKMLYEYSTKRFDFTHAEDSLLLFGWSHLYRRDKNENILNNIAEALWKVNERLDSVGVFQFDNSTTHRHQNQMYTIWGICEAVQVTDITGYLDSVEQVLDYAIKNRMREDGAFIWDEPSYKRQVKRKILKRLGGRPPHWDFLYACHQTFFVNAVMRYYAAGGRKNYDQEVREAMSWIYGDNDLGKNLVKISGLGVPMRQMTVDNRMDVSGQMYKGSYEIGSYVMALTSLLEKIRY